MNPENGVGICSVRVAITVAMCAVTLLVDQHEEQLICKPAPFVTKFLAQTFWDGVLSLPTWFHVIL